MSETRDDRDADVNESRRRAISRLTIAATVIYSAPTVLHLDRNAHAAASSTGCTMGSPNCT